MTDFSKSRRCGDGMIILNNGHTPLSPGAVYQGRTEYLESRRLIEAVERELSGFDVKITEGREGYSPKGHLFIFHKGISERNERKSGAEVLVPENASSDTQYRAFRLLEGVCGCTGLRYRGVHPVAQSSPFNTLRTLPSENAYLIKAGFIDSEKDNLLFDEALSHTARAIAGEIMRISKEGTNEAFS